MARHEFYYKLHSEHVSIHLSRAEMRSLQTKIAKALAKRSRGHREFWIGLCLRGRCWHRLSITHRAAHKRHAKERAEATKPWVIL